MYQSGFEWGTLLPCLKHIDVKLHSPKSLRMLISKYEYQIRLGNEELRLLNREGLPRSNKTACIHLGYRVRYLASYLHSAFTSL